MNCLNSRQAWWALIFNQFIFNLCYCPGSKNYKADTLSRLFDLQEGLILSKKLLTLWKVLTCPLSAQPTLCMFPIISIPESSSGVTHPASPASREWHALASSCNNVSDGRLLSGTARSLLQPFSSAPSPNLLSGLPVESCALFRSPNTSGHTSDFVTGLPPSGRIPPYSPLFTNSPK